MPRTGAHPMLTFLPPALAPLADLACDLRWSWNHSTDVLWQSIDAAVWGRTRNPVLVLRNASRDRIAQLAADPQFMQQLAAAQADRQDYLTRPAWFEQRHPNGRAPQIAYFSMEYGITDALPLYSGGLGVLAGDHLKTASDLGVPLVAVGLLYGQGYFRQLIDAHGWQIELYPTNSPYALPVRPIREDGGAPLKVTINLPGRELLLRAWHASVGRVQLYLLDSDDPLNSPADRGITGQLYGGDLETRFMQEIVLGFGGWQLLEKMGVDVDVCHLNEGHAAFVTLERARHFMATHGVEFWDALWATRAGNIFTTHTPVAAAFDTFPRFLLEKYGSDYAATLGIGAEQLLGLGRREPDDLGEPFNMAYLAARSCARLNGVSRLHGEVSRRIFAPLYPRWPESEVPVSHVTNAVHVPTWDSPWADRLWTEACGKERWLGSLQALRAAIEQIGDAELWSFRAGQRGDLVDYARDRLTQQLAQRGAAREWIRAARDVLDPNVLTLGFARRFTEYKRPDLLLTDTDRLLRLLNSRETPVQLIVAGKAHPHDDVGKRALQRWAQLANRSDARRRVVLIEDYDMTLAQKLVQGVDVWINTPRRPWEASGTSGMKVLVNGGLNLSELDGWWAEAWSDEVGWALGDGAEHAEPGWDAHEAAELYALLERQVVPDFYRRDVDGVPRAWVQRIRASMSQLTPQFSSNRMLAEYVERMYLPAAADHQERVADGAKLARELRSWLHQLHHHWREIHWGRCEIRNTSEGLAAAVQVYLGNLPVDAIRLELYADPGDDQERELLTLDRGEPLPGALHGYTFAGQFRTTRAAEDFTPRVVPFYRTAAVPEEARFIRWYPE
jgi:starch phosphorylase